MAAGKHRIHTGVSGRKSSAGLQSLKARTFRGMEEGYGSLRPGCISLSLSRSIGEKVFTSPDGSAFEILATTRPPAESAFVDRLYR
jgi:hypothetical protein